MDKTMIFNFDYGRIQYPDTVTSLKVNESKTFKYLGDKVKYDESSTREAELELHTILAEATFHELLKKLTNHQINLTRVLILKCLVHSKTDLLMPKMDLNRELEICHVENTTDFIREQIILHILFHIVTQPL